MRDFSASTSAFNEHLPQSRERDHTPIYVEERRVQRNVATQVYELPKRVGRGQGPFPQELLKEPEIVTRYVSEINEDGSEFEPGSTAQNNYRPPIWMRCATCFIRLRKSEIEEHVCV